MTNKTTIYRVEHKDSLLGPYNHNDGNDIDRVMKYHGPDADGPQPTAFVDIDGLPDWAAEVSARAGVTTLERARFFCITMGKFPVHARFGFANLDQLKRWFGDSFETLAANGYVIGVYAVDTDTLKHGRNQVAFYDAFADRIDSLSFSAIAT